VQAAGTPAGPAPLRSPPSGAATPLPGTFRLTRDPSTLALDDGSVLMGGSPLRLLRLSARARDQVARWQTGAEVGEPRGRQLLARRLASAGVFVAQPGRPMLGPDDVTVVVPVRDRAEQLDRLLGSLRGLACIVVDDASADAAATKDAAERHGARFVGLAANLGPSGARNAGLAVAQTPIVAFVDSDCFASPGWLPALLGHFDDPLVAAVAPRVVPAPTAGATSVSRYEAVRSSLDRGARAGLVRPQSRVSYVPSAALVVRRDVSEGTTLFDPALRGGEDVDLVWRLVAAGWDVRYEPSVTMEHQGPSTVADLVAKRWFYGTTAAPLARRHPGALAPFEASGWSVAVWAAALARRPLLAATAMAASVAILAGRLRGLVRRPAAVAARIAGGGTARAALPALGGVTRTWAPLLVLGLLARRARRPCALALLLPALADWARNPGESDVIAYSALHVADDVAYGAGVWAGCVRERTAAPLVPRIVWRSRVWSARGLHDTLGRGVDAG
jgi:mycofactocin system glycosyltransferase